MLGNFSEQFQKVEPLRVSPVLFEILISTKRDVDLKKNAYSFPETILKKLEPRLSSGTQRSGLRKLLKPPLL